MRLLQQIRRPVASGGCVRYVMVSALLLAASCASLRYLPYPDQAKAPRGEPLPLDGTWISATGVRFRIDRGVMYIDDPSVTPPLKNGHISGRAIRQVSARKYTLESGSHNLVSGRVSYGPGEVEILSRSKMVVRTFPNDNTGLWQTSETEYRCGQLVDEALFLKQLGEKAAPDSPTDMARPAGKDPSVAWAVVVGLSTYRDHRIPALRYGDSDAAAFHEWLVSEEGGGLAPARTKLLLNENATAGALKDALFNWLGQALKEDLVIVYFAGHGSPQSPEAPDNLFLLLHDTDYSNIAATAFPMWDVETALKRFIRARKIIVMADACHSGGVGQDFDISRRADRGAKVNPIAEQLQALSAAGDGICIISASDVNQFSQEGEQWGGGRGVFTHFLIEGLKGEADYNRDGRATLGELIPYLSEQVRRATKNAQSPTVSGRFDPALSIRP